MLFIDQGSEDIEILPNGKALITSVSSITVKLYRESLLLYFYGRWFICNYDLVNSMVTDEQHWIYRYLYLFFSNTLYNILYQIHITSISVIHVRAGERERTLKTRYYILIMLPLVNISGTTDLWR